MNFSVVIPTKNRQDNVLVILAHLMEFYVLDEIIIIFNGEQSNPSYLLDYFVYLYKLKGKKLIFLYDNKVQNPQYLRMKGLKECTNEYVLFLDDDTLPMFDWEILTNWLEKSNEGLIGFAVKDLKNVENYPDWKEEGTTLEDLETLPLEIIPYRDFDFNNNIVYYRTMNTSGVFLIKKSWAKEWGNFKFKFNQPREDVYWNYKLLEKLEETAVMMIGLCFIHLKSKKQYRNWEEDNTEKGKKWKTRVDKVIKRDKEIKIRNSQGEIIKVLK